MHNAPSNNTHQTKVGDQEPDVLAAIAAAAATIDEGAQAPATTPVAQAPAVTKISAVKTISSVTAIPAQAPTPTSNQEEHAPEPEADAAAEPVTIKHEHRGELDEAEYDTMLNKAFEEREAHLARRKKITRLTAAACILALCGSGFAWYSSSENNQAMVHNLWTDTVSITQEVKEGADVGKIMETYDEALDKVAVRQDQINDASVSLGQDPTKDDAESRERLARQMKTVTGDARTTMDRDKDMQKKFGKLAEAKRAEIEAKRKKEQEDRN